MTTSKAVMRTLLVILVEANKATVTDKERGLYVRDGAEFEKGGRYSVTLAYILRRYPEMTGTIRSAKVMRDALKKLRDAGIVSTSKIKGVNGLLYWAVNGAPVLAIDRLGINLSTGSTTANTTAPVQKATPKKSSTTSDKPSALMNVKENDRNPKQTLQNVIFNLIKILHLAHNYIGSHPGHFFHTHGKERTAQVTTRFLQDNYLAYTGTAPPTVYLLRIALGRMQKAGVLGTLKTSGRVYYYLNDAGAGQILQRARLARIGMQLPVSTEEMKTFMQHVSAISPSNPVVAAIVTLINEQGNK